MAWLWILLGVVGVLFVIGILAAIAIPSFMNYQKKAKRSEAELNLNYLRRGAMNSYAENSQFPIGKAGPTPALGECCAGPNHKCDVDGPRWFNDPVWSALDFELTSPTYFSFAYESTDGKSFTASAFGDLDCDGTYIEYKLVGTSVNGNPTVEVLQPTGRD